MLKTALRRRGFLQALATAPFVAKQAAEQAAMGLMNGKTIGAEHMAPPNDLVRSALSATHAGGIAQGPSNPAKLDRLSEKAARQILKLALNDPDIKRELNSLMMQTHRTVAWLDTDLAMNRSMSLAAKICFQRQRNVARDLQQELDRTNPWTRMQRFVGKLLYPGRLLNWEENE
jgi:hypothetical protein